MRLFTSQENQILKKIVDVFRQGEPQSLAELQVARLLRNELGFFAIRWSTIPNNEVIIYSREQENKNTSEIDAQYFDIADFIYFIEELEDLGFIKLQKIPSKKEDNFTILFDKVKYKYDKATNTFLSDIIINDGEREIKGQGIVPLKEWRKFNTDFAKDLQRCGLSIIYPLPSARDYVDHKFKTVEYRQYIKQYRSALWAAILSAISAIVALITLIFTIYTNSKQTDENSLAIDRIEAAIKGNHIKEPLEIKSQDTILVKPVPPKSKPINK